MPPPPSNHSHPTPPASFASKVDAEEHSRAQLEAQETPAILANRSASQDFVNNQRRDTVSLSTADTARRILNSLYTTDVFSFTDTSLIEWFRKDKFAAREATRTDAPFFSTPSLAALMFKDKPTFKREVEDLQTRILSAEGPLLEEALITLTERIVEHFKPSVPTTVKLAVYLVTNADEITDESLIGLDSGATKVGLVTSFIENYYQVEDDGLDEFGAEECVKGKTVERPGLDGSFADLPGYLRLRAERPVFTTEATAAAYDNTWAEFWRMLKSVLCFDSKFTPDIDLAQRQRIINGKPDHPLRQQFTESGLEPARIWLGRLRRADDAGMDFERRAGFDCGLTLDDMGQISVGTDAIHEAMKPAFDLVLMRMGAETVTVPRVNHAGTMEADRQLPKLTWPAWKEAFAEAYKLYKAQLNKPSFPITTSTPITSKLTREKTTRADEGDQSKPRACKWCKSTEHHTCDCPSEGRRTAGVCRAYQRGKCRQGARHCKYLHIRDPSDGQISNSETNLTQEPTKSSKNSQLTPSGTQYQSQSQGQNPHNSATQSMDDFTKPCDRTCVVPGCGKTFHLPLEGDFGVKWYAEKGMFLPKRCEDCIKAGKRVTRTSSGPGQTGLGPQAHMCSSEDPEAVDTLLCSDTGARPEQGSTQANTLTWCIECGAQTMVVPFQCGSARCGDCLLLDSVNETASHTPIEIIPPPTGPCSLMIELSEATSTYASNAASVTESNQEPTLTACKECGEVGDLCSHWRCIACCEMAGCSCMGNGLSDDSDDSVTGTQGEERSDDDTDDTDSSLNEVPVSDVIGIHEVHSALLEQWRGLEVHPQAFVAARELVYRFFVEGCSDSHDSLQWDGSFIIPTGELVSRLFKLICRSPLTQGMASHQLELAYGLGEALSELTLGFSSCDTTTDDSSEEYPWAVSSKPESPSAFFTRITSEVAVASNVSLTQTSIDIGPPEEDTTLDRPRRKAEVPDRFIPSPTGFRQESLSDDEYFAAVVDNDLTDAVIQSDGSDDSDRSSSMESLIGMFEGALGESNFH